ncbi:MAG: hypothetical protein NVSMB3_07490 [Acidobacteriaceae bacterium]
MSRIPSKKQQLSNLVQTLFLAGDAVDSRAVGFFAATGEDLEAQELAFDAALALAEKVSEPVCLVDLSARTHRLDTRLNLTPFRAEELLASSQPLAVHAQKHGPGQLHVLAISDSTEQQDRVSERACERIWEEKIVKIRELRQRFPYLLLLSPSLVHRAEFKRSLESVDGVVQVVRCGKTRRKSAQRALDEVRSAGGRVLGAVMTDRQFPLPEPIYH